MLVKAGFYLHPLVTTVMKVFNDMSEMAVREASLEGTKFLQTWDY